MISDDSRRKFLGTTSVIATGLALGAFTKSSLAADPKNIPADVFVKRADRLLGAAAIRDLVAGKTMIGITHKGGEFLAYFDSDGTVAKMVDVRREKGRWQITQNNLAFKFPTLGGGAPFSLQIHQHPTGPLYKAWSPTDQRWAWFVVEPGRAKELT